MIFMSAIYTAGRDYKFKPLHLNPVTETNFVLCS